MTKAGNPVRCAVVGNPIAHSLSPMIHRLFAEQTGVDLMYDRMQLDTHDFERGVRQFFKEGGIGLNVTHPFKQRAFLMSSQSTERCFEAKAANVLWQDAMGQLCADNTDGIGWLQDVSRHLNLSKKRVLLLGAGGAARGILAPLLASGIQSLTIANRTLKTASALCALAESMSTTVLVEVVDTPQATGSFDCILNATSAGLHQQQPWCLLPVQSLSTTLCYDLNYQWPGETPFVAWARARGAVGVDGLGMLIEQAAESFFIWHGVHPLKHQSCEQVMRRCGLDRRAYG